MGNNFSLSINLEHGDKREWVEGVEFCLNLVFLTAHDLNGFSILAVVAGTSLRGNVVLDVKRKIEAAHLSLVLLGKESTVVSFATKTSR